MQQTFLCRNEGLHVLMSRHVGGGVEPMVVGKELSMRIRLRCLPRGGVKVVSVVDEHAFLDV